VQEYALPRLVQELQGARTVPFGDAIIATRDTVVGCETCEEAFVPDAPHIAQTLAGAEIITNSSGSHHELRKLDVRLNLILEGTRKTGGIYLYSNQQGCDGDRLGYDGCAMVCMNGRCISQGPQFSLSDVNVVTATLDLEEVRSYRYSPSRAIQANQAPEYPRIFADFSLSAPSDFLDLSIKPNAPRDIRYHSPWEEIALGPAVYMWDYIRRSGAAGILLPLSGGLDSCSVATIIFSMCREVLKAIQRGDKIVLKDCRRIAGAYEKPDWIPKSPQAICHNIFHTVYLGMETQSSAETRERAKTLSEAIGSYHLDTNIDPVFKALKGCLTEATGFVPKFKTEGGQPAESLALQNIQARSRMVLSYQYAQLLPTIRERPGGGSLLVLSAGNLEEQLRGYATKYDCSSGDVNLIGSISKVDLIKFLGWAQTAFDLPCLESFIKATPTAELEPITASYVQSDEADMGFTYEELSRMGRLRKQERLGPYGMFEKLIHDPVWEKKYEPHEIATKVKDFHHFYAINRHKTTVLTPSYHAESYSCDSHRFDLRPVSLSDLLYNSLADGSPACLSAVSNVLGREAY
jgi:NAD+ synthase (glutamine-hydrolysing)